jgi:hypothetical protein
MGDKAGTATVPLAGRSANDAHHLAIKFEFHFRLGQQARPLADLSRNGHLTLGRDAHGFLLTLTCKSKYTDIKLQASAAKRQLASRLAKASQYCGKRDLDFDRMANNDVRLQVNHAELTKNIKMPPPASASGPISSNHRLSALCARAWEAVLSFSDSLS